MLGYVLVFRPSTQSGMIQSEQGETYRFSSSCGSSPLQAGDRVFFEPAPTPDEVTRTATLVSIMSPWSDRLPPAERAKLAELCRNLEIQAAV